MTADDRVTMYLQLSCISKQTRLGSGGPPVTVVSEGGGRTAIGTVVNCGMVTVTVLGAQEGGTATWSCFTCGC